MSFLRVENMWICGAKKLTDYLQNRRIAARINGNLGHPNGGIGEVCNGGSITSKLIVGARDVGVVIFFACYDTTKFAMGHTPNEFNVGSETGQNRQAVVLLTPIVV